MISNKGILEIIGCVRVLKTFLIKLSFVFYVYIFIYPHYLNIFSTRYPLLFLFYEIFVLFRINSHSFRIISNHRPNLIYFLFKSCI